MKLIKMIFFLIISIVMNGCPGSQSGTGVMRPVLSGKQPLIYSPDYSIQLLGLEKLHPFDSAKYKKVYDALISRTGLTPDQFYTPETATDTDLQQVHSKEYLNALKDPSLAARIAGVPEIAMIPPHLIEESIYRPMKLATGGTILGTSLALSHGWAINLSGGYHHAKSETGGGFCYFADIPIAVYSLWEKKPELRVLIVDLDAHQGNGYASVFRDDERVFIFDLFNKNIYPMDTEAAAYIDFPHPIASGTGDAEYLGVLEKTLPPALETAKPDLVIYNAGTDVYEEDPLGQLKVSKKGIINRDRIVFSRVMAKKIPICMVLSGGYTQKSAEIIADSIESLLTTAIPRYSGSE